MTDEEKKVVIGKLIELNLWSANEQGDPTIDEDAANRLLESLKSKLAPGYTLVVMEPVGGVPAYEVLITGGATDHQSSTGLSRTEAICNAAIALPEFLMYHPEYRAPETITR